MGKLTAKTTEKLAKEGTAGLTGDGEGLYLKVSAGGTGASWVFRYKIDSKSRYMGLGKYPETSLSEAREKAADARKLSKSGTDPLAVRDSEREAKRLQQQAELAKATPFKMIAASYIAAHRSGWKNAKHAQQWENTLATYAEPIIGHLPASEITTAHVLEILQPIWAEKNETANRLRNRIELVLDAAKARGLRDGENPARWRGHLDKLLPKRSKLRSIAHHNALPWPELPAFMADLAQHDELTYKAMRLTILTACRTSEILGATWAEIDQGKRMWTIPAARMKAQKEHRIPLSEAALEVLASLPRIKSSPYLFPGARQGKHLSNMAMLMGLRRMGREDLTMHGFRSTFRDWAAEQTNYPREVCEMALAHKVADGTEAAYWRGDALEKRRALMADWAVFCTSKK
ncbi:integrase arm-type DNA-binding domain-containing protein [Pseudomonas sp. LPB0260]|uniref:tyrosine-type recombinase/integrase n=1 Tax=Pseudomonas sp. LPB0260 TaxID=2614442 RepID=UPI0015C228F8|nr:site-specific integrase [Pseudomonas sp. LPB0260]QLC72352.1 integrase arm-type DNA-binding domain-containing protein [Pseudomonas sp. LPB0260]QLC75129.1 integrase arm-type DNA-binding domain-containing protein [Pseudomonas sp. LPB0260]